MLILLYILMGYLVVGFIVAVLTAHRLQSGWMWLLAFAFVTLVWPAMIFDYWTDKVDF